MRRLLIVGSLALLLTARPGAALEIGPLHGLRAEVAALLMQGVPGGSLPIAVAVFAQPAAAGGDVGGLDYLVELPPAPPDRERPLELYLYAVDDNGEVAAHAALGLEQWPAAGEGVKIGGRLETFADRGRLSLRFVAWDPVGREYGLAVREIARPGAPPAPRFTEECSGWHVAGGPAAELAAYTARPVLVVGEQRRMTVGGAADTGWRVRLLADGTSAQSAVEVEAAPAGAGELQFVVPPLPAGVYRLSVAAAADSWSSPPVEGWVVPALPPADEGCSGGWRRVLRLASAGGLASRPLPDPEPSAARGRRPVRRLRASYEDLLVGLAAMGDLQASARRLADLEAPHLAEDPGQLRLLLAAELDLVGSLSRREPRCLLPLVALHAETYRVHHEAGRFQLASHSRRLATAIAELAADRLEAPEERALLSVALAALADRVQMRRASLEAQRLLQRALELDPAHEAARLLLAVSYERKGRLAEARRELELLVTANSAHHEARVRLAILLRRMGETEGAERLLRAVAAERPPAWLLSLAYQTLAQGLVREARLGEAVDMLRAALQRLPGDPALQVLRAYALDRAGRRREMRQALDEIVPGDGPPTPRFRYSDEPVAALGLLRETLRQAVTVRLSLLTLALGERRREGAAG